MGRAIKQFNFKTTVFALLCAAAIGVAFIPLRDLLRDTSASDYYSHIPLIPIASAVLMFLKRREVFGVSDSIFLPGLAVMAAAVGLYCIGGAIAVGVNDYASVAAMSSLLLVAGSFLMLFGREAFRRAAFPFAFLIWCVPFPAAVLERVVSILVTSSTVLTGILFKLLGVSYVREGAVFHLPDMSIEIASQCSGIRSSMALVITTVLAAHLFLKKFRNKAFLVLAVFPVAEFKNAVRIVTLYLISYYIDTRIIEGGFLHKSGGFVFFGLGLAIIGAGLLALRKWERKK